MLGNQRRLRAAIECLPFENPKLSATAVSHVEERSFAAALERAIERRKAPLPTVENGADELKGPTPRLLRRF